MKKIIILISLVVVANSLFAQDMLEKAHPISRKAKRGYLGNIEKKENGNFDMIYVLPSSSRKIKYEIYHFDKDANQTGVDKDEIEIEKAKTKWHWFNYKGDFFVANSLTASANMTSQLVFRKKEITAHYNWWTGHYVRKIEMKAKVKPRDENGNKYGFAGGAYEVERDSSVLVMALKSTKSYEAASTTFELLKCDNNVNITPLKTITFPYAMRCIFSKPLQDEQSDAIENDDMPRDWILIYAPSNLGRKATKAPDNDANKFQYLRISPEGVVKEQFGFASPTAGFRILDAYEKNGKVLLYGMGIGKEDKLIDEIFKINMVATTSASADEKSESNAKAGSLAAMGGMFSGKADMGIPQEDVDAQLDELKYTHFAFATLQNGQLTSASITDMKEVNTKAVAPEGEKRPLKFDGNKFFVGNVQIMSDNSIVMCTQDFKTTKAGRIYKGMYMMHFTEKGELMHNYTVEIEQKNKRGFFNKSPLTSDMFTAKSYLYESADKSKITWVMHIVKAIDKDQSIEFGFNSSTTTTSWSPLYGVEYGTIDLAKGKSSAFKTLGDDERREYYLFAEHNSLAIENYVYFFSETSRGDKILISRLGLK
jgi:hypothetical protein